MGVMAVNGQQKEAIDGRKLFSDVGTAYIPTELCKSLVHFNSPAGSSSAFMDLSRSITSAPPTPFLCTRPSPAGFRRHSAWSGPSANFDNERYGVSADSPLECPEKDNQRHT